MKQERTVHLSVTSNEAICWTCACAKAARLVCGDGSLRSDAATNVGAQTMVLRDSRTSAIVGCPRCAPKKLL